MLECDLNLEGASGAARRLAAAVPQVLRRDGGHACPACPGCPTACRATQCRAARAPWSGWSSRIAPAILSRFFVREIRPFPRSCLRQSRWTTTRRCKQARDPRPRSRCKIPSATIAAITSRLLKARSRVDSAGMYSAIGGRSAIARAREVLPGAAMVIAAGSCASDGGWLAAAPNPTSAMGVNAAVPGLTTPGQSARLSG